MKINDKLNSEQKVLAPAVSVALMQEHTILQEIKAAGYDIDFYEISGFGGLTVVPSNNRVRIKVNGDLLWNPEYGPVLADKLRQSFESRLDNAQFLAGKKVSSRFCTPKKGFR